MKRWRGPRRRIWETLTQDGSSGGGVFEVGTGNTQEGEEREKKSAVRKSEMSGRSRGLERGGERRRNREEKLCGPDATSLWRHRRAEHVPTACLLSFEGGCCLSVSHPRHFHVATTDVSEESAVRMCVLFTKAAGSFPYAFSILQDDPRGSPWQQSTPLTA